MRQGYKTSRKGIIHAKCSHPLADYCKRRQTQDKRSITLTWVPEGDALLALQEKALGPTQPKHSADGPGWLGYSIICCDEIVNNFPPIVGDVSIQFCVVALEQPGVKFLRTSVMMSYLTNDHYAHGRFQAAINDGRPNVSPTFTLDWDWDPITESHDHPIQWLCSNAIRTEFCRDCSLAYQKMWRSKDRKPWPGGVLTPPFALGLDALKGPADGEEAFPLRIIRT